MRILTAVLAFLLCASCAQPASESAGDSAAEMDALERMMTSFNGSPSREEIREALNDALNATNTSITEENYSRAGSVLVSFRREYGIDEMDLLDCIPTRVTDSRVPSLTFSNVAAVCNVALVQGE